jgi:hypothetical protein
VNPDGRPDVKTSKILQALSDVASDMLAMEFPQVAERSKIEVKYFGHGNKFAIQRDDDGVRITLYVHKDNSSALPETIRAAGKAATETLERKVSIKAETLKTLIYHVDLDCLTAEEREEIRSVLL